MIATLSLSLQVGWKTTREYYTFMWVTLPVDLNSNSAKQQEVQFKGEKNTGSKVLKTATKTNSLEFKLSEANKRLPDF